MSDYPTQPRKDGRFAQSHGMNGTPEYRAWCLMKSRCLNPKFTSYPRYGGRGITVCERWLNSFANFYADMGRKPSPEHSLDRKEANSNYEPGNCRWATFEQQQQNRPDNVLSPELVAAIRASKESASRIAHRLGISISAVCRARNGETWSNVEHAE